MLPPPGPIETIQADRAAAVRGMHEAALANIDADMADLAAAADMSAAKHVGAAHVAEAIQSRRGLSEFI